MGVKRLFSLLAALLVAVAIAGCGDDEKTAQKAGATGPTATSTVSEPGGATGATGKNDSAGKKDSADKKDSAGKKDSADKNDDSDKRDDDSATAPDDSDDSGGGKDNSTDNTPRPPTGLQFLINDRRFVGRKLQSGPYKRKFGREVPPNSPIVVRIGVFDRGSIKLRVKGPNSKIRVYNARKLRRLRALSIGQAYELKIAGTRSKAYIYAAPTPHIVGPAG